MHTIVCAASVVSASVSAYATPFVYQCKALDQNAPYGIERLSLSLNGSRAVVAFADFTVKRASYALGNYVPKEPSMQPFARIDLVKVLEGGTWPDGAISDIFIEKTLFKGGVPLRIGKLGGFLKMTGHGYSWAKYLCWK